MSKLGMLIVFESAPKGGKTTLAAKLTERLRREFTDRQIVQSRGALTESTFASEVKNRAIHDLGYSTAFYWADLVFHTHDVIAPSIQTGDIVVHDRYDLSIVSYRETYGLHDDQLLLDEYLRRGIILSPDVTVFLDPPLDVMLARIRGFAHSSVIDRAFLGDPTKLALMQERVRHHLARLGRKSLTLDTDSHSIDDCVDQIFGYIKPML